MLSLNHQKLAAGIPSRVHGLVLAGGYGKRIGVLSDPERNRFPIAKPALPVGNQPVMRGVLLAMREMGAATVTIATKHAEHTVRKVIGDGAKFGLRLDYLDMAREKVEDWGTAWTANRWLQWMNDNARRVDRFDTLVVLSGDTLWDDSIAAPFMEAFAASLAWAQIVVCESVWEDIFGSYGIVQLNDPELTQAYQEYLADCRSAQGEAEAITQARIKYTAALRQGLAPHRQSSLPITQFVEKPRADEVEKHVSNLGNASIYAMLAEAINYYRSPPGSVERTLGRGFADFGFKMFQDGFVQDQIPFDAFIPPPDWYWLDIGTPGKLLRANLDVLEGRHDAGTLGRAIRPGVWIGQGVRASSVTLDALKQPVIIGDFVTIEEGAIVGPYAVIGQDWIIKNGARVSGSLLLPPFYEDRLDAFKVVHPGAEIRDCIIAGGEIDLGQRHERKIIVVAPNGELSISELEL